MNNFLYGICHPGRTNYDALEDAGINTIRVDIPFPFSHPEKDLAGPFRQTSEWVQEICERGFTVIGISPYPRAVPSWDGGPGSDEWFGTVREACTFLGEHFAAHISIWQSTNEMNVDHFREPLDLDQAVRFVEESARGLREGAPGAMIGANMGGFNDRVKDMYDKLYRGDNGIEWDYIGTDGYFGTWEAGGPQTWPHIFDELAKIADLPVIVMEWGYSSAGGVMAPEDVIEGEIDVHETQKWCFGWETETGEVRPHDAATQARFIEEALPILRERSIGAVYYCMSDADTCWCGSTECPAESNWGLLNSRGEKKPSFLAMRRTIKKLQG